MGTTPGSAFLIFAAAEMMSAQDLGCQGTAMPAFCSSVLLYHRPRVSVPMETP